MGLDLGAYLRRTGFDRAPKADMESLVALHRAHALAIPFENLAIQMGEGVDIGLSAVQDKLVARRRGGYCFEQNTLFLAVLREIGFEADAFEARVRLGATRELPRTHMLIRVRLGQELLCDVGFGGQGLLEPVPMDGAAHGPEGRQRRVAEEGPLRALQSKQLAGWSDLYVFEPIPRGPVDQEMGNWYTSTHPESRFVTTLTAQRVLPDGWLILRNLSLTTLRGDEAEERILARGELTRVLREAFGLDVPEDARFRALDA